MKVVLEEWGYDSGGADVIVVRTDDGVELFNQVIVDSGTSERRELELALVQLIESEQRTLLHENARLRSVITDSLSRMDMCRSHHSGPYDICDCMNGADATLADAIGANRIERGQHQE